MIQISLSYAVAGVCQYKQISSQHLTASQAWSAHLETMKVCIVIGAACLALYLDWLKNHLTPVCVGQGAESTA
jgi:hypothetical protein